MLKIRECRKAKGMTMRQLGEKVGALESSISFYERGVQQPDLEMLNKRSVLIGKWIHTRSVIGSSPI